MQDQELRNMWTSYDQKLEEVLSLNKELLYQMTQNKLHTTIGTMRKPKLVALVMGIPYTLLLYSITIVTYLAGATFVTLGFGAISLIMTVIVLGYLYHLYLIGQVRRSQDIVETQAKLASLKISSFNLLRLAIVQVPFWSICWMSVEALKSAPLLYGGGNAVVFLGLTYLVYWLYQRLSIEQSESKVSQFFLSGMEWTPLLKSVEILEQLKELKT